MHKASWDGLRPSLLFWGFIVSGKISEQTVVSISVLTLIVGLAFWVGTIWMLVQRHDQDIAQMKSDIVQDRKAASEKMDRVVENLAQVSAQLEILIKMQERRKDR